MSPAIAKKLTIFLAILALGLALGAWLGHSAGFSSGYGKGGKDKEASIQAQIKTSNSKADDKVREVEEELRAKGAEFEAYKQAALETDRLHRLEIESLKKRNGYLLEVKTPKGEVIYVETKIPDHVYTSGYLRLWNNAIRGETGDSKIRPSSTGTGTGIQNPGTLGLNPDLFRVNITQYDLLDNQGENLRIGRLYKRKFEDLREAVIEAQKINHPVIYTNKKPE